MTLIVCAHPDFNASVANKAVIETVANSGLNAEIRQLAELYPDFRIDAEAERQALLRHQTVVFQYPFFWYNMPAILKHYFDQVFTYGFAYGSAGDKLKGKNFLASFTVGAPEADYRATGSAHFRVYEFCKNLEQTAYYAQMNYIDPFYFHGTSAAAGFGAESVRATAEREAGRLAALLKTLEA
ncbi:NAD(P)H-dependent oxidoreductase [Neisseria chenwenguii]|uniref:General stress protein n=1 Tax=Neisseria chenwenguii TaxID=1853278 RepID=A0A220S375_9NEIS|nr:NAD(P)H-dependent oxidoreductase [Neisseria chenwenguii]ASK27892.1 general stress protein [Neisseria chenwenguii]ROV56253.1 flavodoxin family protein [Neisseria chenwenguii]